MAKKQQMRWTDGGAHYLAQVRVAALNGELSPARMVELAKRVKREFTGLRRPGRGLFINKIIQAANF